MASELKHFSAHGGELRNLMHSWTKEELSQLVSLPRITLTERQMCDLELLMNGGFSPLEGFMTEEDYRSVVNSMRLASGDLWPMPIVLDVPDGAPYQAGDDVILCDPYGKMLAVLSISSVYKPDKEKEAVCVYGKNDSAHPGVKTLFEKTGPVYLGGKVKGIAYPDKYDFHELRFSPQELREWFAENGWDAVIAFQTRNPLHRAHFEIIRRAASRHNAKVLLHPVVGLTKEGDIDYLTRVRCYKKLHESYMGEFTRLSLLPLAMRMAGPREALWHAIIRKNYGATHFIVGRDHAGPGKDSQGEPFYGPYDAQNLLMAHAEELGITAVPFKEMVYVVERDAYFPADEVPEGGTVKNISGTEVRRMLLDGTPIPEWFSFPEIIEELRRSAAREARKGFTIFFTGLSGAGKSTIAHILASKLLELQERKVTILDGDIVRQNLSKGLGFSREDRIANITRIGFVANEIAKHGGIAICAAIAPNEEARAANRKLIEKNGAYIEVYVATPIEVCEERDVKGLYKKARRGEMKGFTGVDDPYEVPEHADIVLDASFEEPLLLAEKAIAYLRERKLI